MWNPFKRQKSIEVHPQHKDDRPTGTMTASKQMDITELLHRRWEEIDKECDLRQHKDQHEHWLNYCHIQRVNLCNRCYELGLEEHVILYKKLIEEGFKP